MKKTDLAYYAGIIDGEGAIFLNEEHQNKANPNKITWRLNVAVSNTNEWICQQLKFAFGGFMESRPQPVDKNWKPYFQWRVVSKDAANFLKAAIVAELAGSAKIPSSLAIWSSAAKISGSETAKVKPSASSIAFIANSPCSGSPTKTASA